MGLISSGAPSPCPRGGAALHSVGGRCSFVVYEGQAKRYRAATQSEAFDHLPGWAAAEAGNFDRAGGTLARRLHEKIAHQLHALAHERSDVDVEYVDEAGEAGLAERFAVIDVVPDLVVARIAKWLLVAAPTPSAERHWLK